MKFFNVKAIWACWMCCMFLFSNKIHTQSLRPLNGYEWIIPGQNYIKTKIAETGMYRVKMSELRQAGLEFSTYQGKHIQVWNFGKQIPVFVSNDGIIEENDYIEFFGERHTIGMDSLLFTDWNSEMLNPEYSFVTDSNAYFITLDSSRLSERYEIINPDYENNLPQTLSYYIHEDKKIHTDIFYKIKHGELQYSNFEPAEGWAKQGEKESNSTFELQNYINNGVPVTIGARTSSTIFFTLLTAYINGSEVARDTFNPATIKHFEFQVSPVNVQNTMTLRIKNNFQEDLHRLAYAYIKYPRELLCEKKKQFKFSLGDVNGEYLLPFKEFLHENNVSYVYDPVGRRKTMGNIKNNEEVDIILNAKSNHTYYLVNGQDGYKAISSMSLFQAKSFIDTQATYLILTHKNLMSGAEKYATYRSSEEGGGYSVSIAEVNEIYNHFGYGIDRHFYAIKNFNVFLEQKYKQLNHVFILGKGLSYTDIRTAQHVQERDGILSFVPGFGIPSSDIMLFSKGNYANPSFAIGRYASLNDTETENYLDKVKVYEEAYLNNQSSEERFWMKRILHLSGGGLPAEQTLIKNGMLNMQGRVENSKMGARVFTFFKRSTDQLASASLEAITGLINGGVNMITFYGHSAPGTWDFNLEDPSKYQNFGKYPFINSLGCYSGNIFGEKAETISERFVKIKDKGAIGFVASSGTAFINQLGLYGYEKYGLLGDDMYGQSIGTVIKYMADKYKESKYDIYAFYQQLILHCDPAISLYHFDGPDYTFEFSSLKTKPELINSSVDSIYLEFDLYNLGQGVKDSVTLEFYHHLQNGVVFDTVRAVVPAPYSNEKYTVGFKNAGVKGIGKNTIYGIIDPQNEKTEWPEDSAKNNNELVSEKGKGFDFYILDNTALPVEPCNFAIVNEQDVFLRASTSNALIKKGNYIFQIDTTQLFNSPLLTQKKIENVQGLIEWKPEILFQNETVYYWRVSPDSLTPEAGYLWQNASFVYNPQLPSGYNQSHYYQFLENNETGHIYIDEEGVFRFPFGEYLIDIVNGVYGNFPFGTIGYRFNFENPAESIRPWNFMHNGGVAIVLVNPITSGTVVNNNGEFGSISGGDVSSKRCFGFLTNTSSERKKIIDFLQLHVPEEYYVYFFTVMNSNNVDLHVDEWANDEIEFGTSIPKLLKEQGSVLIDSLVANGSFPYTFKYRKNKGALNENLLDDLSKTISTKSFLPYISIEGTVKIENIGVASAWDRLEYNWENLQSVDTTYVNVYGIREGKYIDTLFTKQNTFDLDLSSVDAVIYPKLQVELYIKDSIQRSVPQLEYFRIFFTPVVDLALNPKEQYKFFATKLNRGETLVASLALQNLNDSKVDSIAIKYSIINLEDNSEITVVNHVGPIEAKKPYILNFNQKLSGKPGKHVFVVEANHDKMFMEKHFFNNIGKQEFELLPDKTNPFLDVYFDGQKILDGDIVSSKPEIKMMLKDENAFLALDNPELFSVKLDTGRNQIKEVPLTSGDLSFEAPNGPNEPAILKYHPTFKSGDYRLIVQAKDASGNYAGTNERVVSFRVIEEESITQVINYPNPFSTSTQFIFTLTGEQVPEDFNIRIYTITGKLVKEIRKDELGPLRIGTNRTQYKWDGTDEYGQKLANGVYLYKAHIQNASGEQYKTLSQQKIDAAFHEGFGKMVILR